MRGKLIVIFALLTVLYLITGIVMAETISNIKLRTDLNSQINENAKDLLGNSLQNIANDYTPYSRIGWKLAVSGINKNQNDMNWDIGYGVITGYNQSTGILEGQGKIYRVSPGSSTSINGVSSSPDIESLDNATIDINVKEKKMTVSTGGSDMNNKIVWSEILGTYSNIQEGGNGIFYGFGPHQTMTNSMCILTLTQSNVPTGK